MAYITTLFYPKVAYMPYPSVLIHKELLLSNKRGGRFQGLSSFIIILMNVYALSMVKFWWFHSWWLEIQGTEWDFGVFSGLEGVEKPNPRIYEIALERAGNIAPEEVLHIGDSMRKDYLPAKGVGMHALLLDRFKTPDAIEWSKSGATVLPDLVSVQEWLTSQN